MIKDIEGVVSGTLVGINGWEYAEKPQTVNGNEPSSNNPTIPKGFRPLDTKNASWGNGVDNPSETAVNNGLVIEDEDGNEFVWVPCHTTNGVSKDLSYPEYKKHDYGSKITNDQGTVLEQRTDEEGWVTWYYVGNTWTDEASSYGAESVAKYGGFWIGRYEAGIPEIASFYPSKDYNNYKTTGKNVTQEGETKLKPVSKPGYFAWNFVNQTTAKNLSKQMYSGESGFESYLVDGMAWDTALKWIGDSKYINDSTKMGNYLNNGNDIKYTGWYAEHIWASKQNSGTWEGWMYGKKYTNGTIPLQYNRITAQWDSLKNNYTAPNAAFSTTNNNADTRIEIPTGAMSEFAKKNIYDMAGNMYEWTTETSNKGGAQTFAVLRGGSFYSNGNDPSSVRHGSTLTTVSTVDIGFRVVLYVK